MSQLVSLFKHIHDYNETRINSKFKQVLATRFLPFEIDYCTTSTDMKASLILLNEGRLNT